MPREINFLKGDPHMHLNQFTDPKPYTLSADDAADFLRQLKTLWPNDDIAFVLAIKKEPQSKGQQVLHARRDRNL